MKKTIPLTFAIIIFISSLNMAAEKKRVAIFDITAKNVSQTNADIIRDILEIQLYKAGKFEVLERNQMSTILKEQGLQLSGCADMSCAVQIGKILSADLVVIGTIYKMNTINIAIKIVDIKTSNIVAADSEKINNDNDMENAVNRLISRISENTDNNSTISNDQEVSDLKVSTKKEIAIKNEPIAPSEIKKYFIEMNLSYLMPQSDLKIFSDRGFGGNVKGGFNYGNMIASFETGYYYFPGKGKDAHYLTVIPLLASCGYKVKKSDIITLVPMISAGVGYNSIKYDINSKVIDSWKIEPIIKLGMEVEFVLFPPWYIYAGGEIGSIIEKDGPITFILVNAGVGIMF